MSKGDVFFDIKITNKDVGRIVFELFDNVVPKTAQNFRQLCLKKEGEGFRGCAFHRIIPGFMAQGGDFTNGDGTGGKSIYGPTFDDQNFKLKHDTPYLLSMANAGKNTNGSQFFITFVKCPWLDGKHVVFGKVKSGQDVVNAIQNYGSEEGEPLSKIVISYCGAC